MPKFKLKRPTPDASNLEVIAVELKNISSHFEALLDEFEQFKRGSRVAGTRARFQLRAINILTLTCRKKLMEEIKELKEKQRPHYQTTRRYNPGTKTFLDSIRPNNKEK